MQKYIFKNQHFIQENQAQISINERGFLFGDGIFETCKIYNSKIYNFFNHLQRIKKGLKTLKLNVDISDLEKISLELITKNKVKDGILRISISRGIGSKGYLPIPEIEALTIIQTTENRQLPKKVNLGISSYQVPKQNFGKTMNSLVYVLNKIEAAEKGFFDNVILSEKNYVAETSSANIFWIKNGKIFTSDDKCGIIAGTMRAKIIELSQQKINVVLAKISALKNADEIFLTNAVCGIILVDEFLGRKLQKTQAKKLQKILLEDIKKSCKN